LDTSYGGGDGIATVNLPGTSGATALVLDSAGRVVFAGYASPGAGSAMVIARLNAAGTSLDTTFNGGIGYNYSDGAGGDRATSIDIGPGGRFVLGGWWESTGGTGRNLAVSYFLSDGTHYLIGGSATNVYPLVGYDSVTDVTFHDDGSVTAGGQVASHHSAVWRLTSARAWDTSFGGGDGLALIDAVTGMNEDSTAMAMDDDGRIIVGGSYDTGSTYRPYVARITADGGSVDTSFGGGDGWSALRSSSDDGNVEDIAIDTAGRILLAGYSDETGGGSVAWATRATSSGGVDRTYGGGDGVFTTNASARHRGMWLALDTRERVLLGTTNTSTDRIAVWRLHGDVADLAVSIRKPRKTLQRNARNRIVMRVTNRGGQTATGATLRATLPARMRYRRLRSTSGMRCRRSGRTATCTITSLAAGRSATMSLIAVPRSNARRTARFRWRVTSQAVWDPKSSNNSVRRTVRVPR
jgi:uncharacterized delta-60 repeat protein